MALTTSYLTSVKNFEGIMNSILGARAPERFTNKFLEDLGYKSSNDRLILGVLKSLGLLNDTGEPTQRYYDFLDQTQSKKVIATGIQEAYEDLFNLKRDAQIDSMARTFKTLCDYADWSEIPINSQVNSTSASKNNDISEKPDYVVQNSPKSVESKPISNQLGLHYNIQIHLPETTNMAVYDAIFQSIKKHLM